MSLLETLGSLLNNHQEMTFMEFMHQALYAPNEGYYSSALQKLGAGGDFVTAPELTPLFGKAVANQCLQIFTHLDAPTILEYGAGTGRLCVDILSHLETNNRLPENYLILEVSAHLRHRQQELIHRAIPHLASRVKWLDGWPTQAFNGVILANEVLDAMPVHRFLKTEQGLLESYVSLDETNQLVEQFKPCKNQRLETYVNEQLTLNSLPYLSEVNLFIDDWMKNNYSILNKGVVLLIDYGFPRHEYYHSDRNQGTIMCHYQHHSHANPLLHPGEQDITAHVDFTHVAEAGYQAGFHVAGYTNQASFLLSNGLLDLMQELPDEHQHIKAAQAVKQLIQPSEMGELFKVIALSKHFKFDLQGFQLHDKRASL